MSEDPLREPFKPRRVNPFGDTEEETKTTEESLLRIEHASRSIRRLKQQLGAEGLTLSATREMIDELTHALDSTARVLRELTRTGQ